MGTSIASRTWGSTDATYAWMLQTSGGTLSSGGAGIIISNGAGIDTGLKLWTDSIGIGTASAYHRIKTLASTAREVTLADAEGLIYPRNVKRLVLSFDRSSTSYASLPDFAFTGQNGFYRFHALLMVRSADATTGVKVQISGGTEVVSAHFHFRSPQASRTALAGAAPSGLPAAFTAADAPDLNPFLIEISGIFRINGAATSGITIQAASEVSGSQVTVDAGSLVIYEWLAA